jgi:glycosyltransferase involved in cell wall biosynthesis
MNKELVSVIIPAFKSESTIASTIESVLSQTYKYFELIVVDDGSPDNTAGVVDKYRDRLTYIRQANGGVSRARNTGIEASNGTYIAFLDSDDIWKENKLEVQMMFFQKHPEVDLIASGFRHRKSNHNIDNMDYKNSFNIFKEYGFKLDDIFDKKSSLFQNNNQYIFYWGDIYPSLFLGNFILPSSVLVKKEALKEVGLFDERYRIAEDTELFLRFSQKYTIGFIDNPLLYYTLSESGNLTGKHNIEQLIKNGIKIQIDSIINSRKHYKENKSLLKNGLSMTYCRLAYFYLTEHRTFESRKYAYFSIRTCSKNKKGYLIYLLSLFPESFLRYLAEIKQWGKKHLFTRTALL